MVFDLSERLFESLFFGSAVNCSSLEGYDEICCSLVIVTAILLFAR